MDTKRIFLLHVKHIYELDTRHMHNIVFSTSTWHSILIVHWSEKFSVHSISEKCVYYLSKCRITRIFPWRLESVDWTNQHAGWSCLLQAVQVCEQNLQVYSDIFTMHQSTTVWWKHCPVNNDTKVMDSHKEQQLYGQVVLTSSDWNRTRGISSMKIDTIMSPAVRVWYDQRIYIVHSIYMYIYIYIYIWHPSDVIESLHLTSTHNNTHVTQ